MDQFKLILWALFLTLFVPLLLWAGLYSLFGWKLFLMLFVGIGVSFLLREKIFRSRYVQGILQMLVPFALTFRFYDALRAGQDKRAENANIFQVLWATSKGFLQGAGDDGSDEISTTALKERAFGVHFACEREDAAREAERVFARLSPTIDSRVESDKADVPLPKMARTRPSDEELDDMLASLKQKVAQKQKEK